MSRRRDSRVPMAARELVVTWYDRERADGRQLATVPGGVAVLADNEVGLGDEMSQTFTAMDAAWRSLLDRPAGWRLRFDGGRFVVEATEEGAALELGDVHSPAAAHEEAAAPSLQAARDGQETPVEVPR